MISIEREHDYPLVLNVSTLQDIHLDGTNFHRCWLNDMDFSGSILKNIDFRSAEMNRAKFISVLFNKCNLIMTESKDACFDLCNFKNTLLLYSDFSGSSFRGADLSRGVIKEVIFKNCDLRGANLCCEGLETCNLEGALFDDATVWYKSYNATEKGAVKS